MAITLVDSIKITKYFKENPIGEIYYLDLCEAIGKRGKISDMEFLEYFIDCVIKEFRKNDKISIKYISKLVVTVQSFLEWVSEANIEVDTVLIDKIRSFEDFYDEYLNRTNFDIDLEFTDVYLASLLEKVNELYPSEMVSESVLYYLNQIELLKEEIAALKRDLEYQKDLYISLEKSVKTKEKEFEKRQQYYDSINTDIQIKESTIKRLEGEVDKLSKKVSQLTIDSENLVIVRNELKRLREELENKSLEVNKLSKIINERDVEIERDKEKLNRDNLIKDLIIGKICEKSCTLEELIEYLKMNEYEVNKQEIYRLIKEIKDKVNLVSPSFGSSPSYKIVAPMVSTNEVLEIEIPQDCKCYDIMLVSDIHLATIAPNTYDSLNLLNDYCYENGIRIILNAGDFFHFRSSSTSEVIKQFTGCEKVVKRAISSYPYREGLYHAVLGGNHDRDALKYGFDPIKKLTDEREDFIYLGYDHAKITFNGNSSIMLHHLKNKYPEPVGDGKYDTSSIIGAINSYYMQNGISRNSSYIDILGHFHKSGFDAFNSLCIMPSYNFDRVINGANHLKVYFDEKKNIKYLVFIPLLKMEDKLIPVTEICYKKLIK